jgi:hypothetical protein
MSTEFIERQLDLVLSDESVSLDSKKSIIFSLISSYANEAIEDFISRNTKAAAEEDFQQFDPSQLDTK